MRTMLETTRKAAPREPARIQKILVPFDFGAPAEHALDFAKTLATTFGASVEVLYVVPYLPTAALPIPELGAIPMATHTVDEMIAEAEVKLREALSSGDPSGSVQATVKIGDPRAQIVVHAAAEDADLIVMGTHGRSGAARFLLGSVAERVVRESACPVLTVH